MAAIAQTIASYQLSNLWFHLEPKWLAEHGPRRQQQTEADGSATGDGRDATAQGREAAGNGRSEEVMDTGSGYRIQTAGHER